MGPSVLRVLPLVHPVQDQASVSEEGGTQRLPEETLLKRM